MISQALVAQFDADIKHATARQRDALKRLEAARSLVERLEDNVSVCGRYLADLHAKRREAAGG